jgi:fibronectin-binding autotransporter adhesin
MFKFAANSNPMSSKFMNTRISNLLVGAALLVSGMHAASAQTWTWVGNTDANTATNSNWNPAGPLDHGLNAIFGAAGSGGTAINWNSGFNIGSITFTSTASAYTMTSGAALRFTSVGVDSIANNSSNLQTFSPEVRVFFNGSKGFNANTGNLSLGDVTFRADNLTTGQTNTLTLTGAASGTIGGTISQSGNFTGVNTAITKTGSGTWTLNGNNTGYSGITTVSNGTLVLGNANALGTSAVTVNGGTLDLAGRTVTLTSLGGSGGTIALGNGGALTANIINAAVTTYSGAITGTGSLTKDGNGGFILASSNNTYVGDTIISNSWIRNDAVNAFGTSGVLRFGSSSVGQLAFYLRANQTFAGVDDAGTINNTNPKLLDPSNNVSSTLTLNVASGTSYAFSGYARNVGTGTLSITKSGSGSQVFSGDSGLVTYTGPTTINAGVLEFSGAGSVANNSAITLAGGTARFAGGGTRSTAIGGTGGLEKTGANLLTLSGSNTYTGLTTISAGTLAVNGSIASAVNVANAAILSGTGTISGLVTVAGGGILAPGNSPGTQTMTSGLALADSSILNFELVATDTTIGGGINDLIVVTGNFLLDGVLNVAGTGDFSTVADNTKWRLFNYSGGTFTDGVLTLGTTPSVGPSGKYFQIDTATAGQVNLVIVPEPGALALAGLGIAAAAWGLRRRRS